MPRHRSLSIAPRLVLAASIGLATPLVPADAPEDPDAFTSRARYLMGTRLTITLPRASAADAFESAFGEVARLEEVMSNWKATSEISDLNRSAGRAPFRCSTDLFDVIRSALDWAERTEGAFDPTVEPLVRRLGLRTTEGSLPRDPSPEDGMLGGGFRGGREPAEGRPAVVGWRHVAVNAAARTVRFDAPGVGIDLGGIGKGAALDAAARVLARHGAVPALLDFGGQILAIGTLPQEDGWPVGIADPDDRERSVLTALARDVSLSTSGNSERGIARAGGAVGHILDPHRGEPARFHGSVTVMAPDATSADALSTALFVMGPKRGARWAEKRGVGALFLWRDGDGALRRRTTRAFNLFLADGAARAARTIRRN